MRIKTYYQVIITIIVLFFSTGSFAYTHTVLHPITWQGEKWEYLVEHPTGKNHVDPAFFEEILDTAGKHGWELVEVSSEYHFYTFYFKRPLLPHKLESHQIRLARHKRNRAASEGVERYTIQTTVNAENAKREAEAAKQLAENKTNPPSTNNVSQPVATPLSANTTQQPINSAPPSTNSVSQPVATPPSANTTQQPINSAPPSANTSLLSRLKEAVK